MKTRAKQLGVKQVASILSGGTAKLSNQLRSKDMEGWFDYYMLDSGELLLVDITYQKTGTLYPSYEKYVELTKKISEIQEHAQRYGKVNSSFSSYLNVGVEEFSSMIKASSQRLATAFSLPLHKLDFTVESLRFLSKAVKKKTDTIDTFEFEEKYFVLISAYCGEVIKRKINGEWKITADEFNMVHQALVFEKQNPKHIYRPESILNQIMARGEKEIRLDVEVISQLHKYGFVEEDGNDESDH